MSNGTKLEVADREQRAIEMYTRPGQRATLEQIAEEIGYANPTSARRTILRAMNRNTVENIEEFRNVNVARIEQMIASQWDYAMGDVQAVRQYIGHGKDKTPLTDDEGREVVYLIPKDKQLDSMEQIRKQIADLRKILGMDHADGIAERQTQVMEAQAMMLATAVKAVLDRLNLTDEQQALVPTIVREEMKAVSS